MARDRRTPTMARRVGLDLAHRPSQFDSTISLASLLINVLLVGAQGASEEIGFRGYLLERTIYLCGSRLGVVLHAFLWGIWYAPIILLSRHTVSGTMPVGGTLVVTCILLGALLGCLRLAAASIAPSAAAVWLLMLGAGLPFLLNGLDVPLRSAIHDPCGWVPMLLILIGIRCAGIALVLGDRTSHRQQAQFATGSLRRDVAPLDDMCVARADVAAPTGLAQQRNSRNLGTRELASKLTRRSTA
jgi:membrane protease YdiL (CAAX protease family)